MSKLRVHELAKEIGRQNKEVMNYLKTRGLDIKSHMSMVEEPWISEVKNKFNNRGKEHIAKLDTPKTEEKVVTAKSEGEKADTQKKKKNIIRVYHAQNASDGGKTKKKPVRSEGDRPAGQRNADGQRNSDSSNTRQSADGDRPRRNNDRFGGNRRPQGDGQGRPQGEGNRQGGRPQGNGQGRPDGNRGEGRDGRFGGGQGRQ